ncbi:MAG: alpha/beta hydrolase, partial [Bacteroidota bacterium]
VDCAAWGGADLGEAFRTGFVTDVPTLLAQGTWDMNTPYENATDLLPAFRTHTFLTIEGGSHGAIREAGESIEGFDAAFHRWFATGDLSQLPERIVLPPLEWEAPEE